MGFFINKIVTYFWTLFRVVKRRPHNYLSSMNSVSAAG